MPVDTLIAGSGAAGLAPNAAPGTMEARFRQRKAHEVAIQFEAMLDEQMVKSMRATVGKDKLMGGGNAEEVYRSMLDHEFALAIAGSGRTGIANMLEKQISRQLAGNGTAVPAVEGGHDEGTGRRKADERGTTNVSN